MTSNRAAKVVLVALVALVGAIAQRGPCVSSQFVQPEPIEQPQQRNFWADSFARADNGPIGGARSDPPPGEQGPPPSQGRQLFRRQVSPGSGLFGESQAGAGEQGGILAGLNNLAQQAQAMSQVQQLIQQAQSLFRSRNPAEATATSALDTAQSTSASALQTAGAGASQTAQRAQTGTLSTLQELAAGLQRIAQNNPNLMPELKNLYDRIAHQVRTGRNQNQLQQQLSAANNQNANYPANIVPANNQYQLADNLAKVALPGLQIGQQPPQPGFYPNLLSSLQNSLQPARLA